MAEKKIVSPNNQYTELTEALAVLAVILKPFSSQKQAWLMETVEGLLPLTEEN